MKAAEKEIEQIERLLREARGLPVDPQDGEELPPIEIPKFVDLQQQLQAAKIAQKESVRKELEEKVNVIEADMQKVQDRLKELADGIARGSAPSIEKEKQPKKTETKDKSSEGKAGAIGPDGTFLEFPVYDGSEPPNDWKKPFTHFCVHTRKAIKQSLDPSERKDKVRNLVPVFPSAMTISHEFLCGHLTAKN